MARSLPPVAASRGPLAGWLALALAALGCGAEPSGRFTLTRLADRLGPAEIVRLRDETRPAVRLALNQPRTCSVESRPGSWLQLALLAEGVPDLGFLELRVLANRKPVLKRRFNLRRRMRRWNLALQLARDGPLELSFQVQLVDTRGSSLPVPAGTRPPRIALGSPRLYVPAPGRQRRVLVWLSQDSLRADHLGAYGYRRPTSPVFDRLASQGVLFENAVSPSPWTLPSMASQFTSRYPSYHGAVGVRRLRDAEHPTLFSVLSQAGFTVLGVTGNRFVSDEFGTATGFDALWFADAGAEELNRIALEALSEWRGGDLALFVHYRDPHFPYEPPARFDRFERDYRGPANGRNFERFGPHQPEDVARVKALYDGEVAFNDAQIGALLAALHRRGLLEDALLVYSSDHGEEFLDHGAWTHSRTLYQELLHVPLLLRLPQSAARRVSAPVSLVDIAPSVIEAFALESPPSFQGRSLLSLARGEAAEPRAVFAETHHGLDQRHRVAVRAGSLKYLLVLPPASEPPQLVSEELFDLAADPEEQSPLAASPAHERLRGEALAFVSRGRGEATAGQAPRLSPDTLAQLRALGYID